MPRAFGAEADQHAGHARRPGGVAVGDGVADEHRPAGRAAGAGDGLEQVARVGLADGEAVGAEQHREAAVDLQGLEQQAASRSGLLVQTPRVQPSAASRSSAASAPS